MAFLVVVGGLQFVYCVLAGNYVGSFFCFVVMVGIWRWGERRERVGGAWGLEGLWAKSRKTLLVEDVGRELDSDFSSCKISR